MTNLFASSRLLSVPSCRRGVRPAGRGRGGFFYLDWFPMKKFFLAFATVLALAGTAPSYAAPAADPQVTAAVKQMFEAMRYRDIMTDMYKQMEASIPANIRKTTTMAVNADARLDPAAKKARLAEMERRLPAASAAIRTLFQDPAVTDEILAAMVPVYARHYTVEEIRQLSAFYKTPVGHKSLVIMPQLMAESMAVSNQVLGPRLHKMMQSLDKKQP